MTPVEDALFPKELLDKRLGKYGVMGWKIPDIPQVVEQCRKHNLAITSCTTEFLLPDATCELLDARLIADPAPRFADEPWYEYSKRSCSEFMTLFQDMVPRTDFELEGIRAFPILKEKKEAGVNILDYLCFQVVFFSEEEYLAGKKAREEYKPPPSPPMAVFYARRAIVMILLGLFLVFLWRCVLQ